ncbi:hypothetical protein [Dyadobacter diqingensis]|uniref:hypothetical protein n=1 Tax=Dyadobacter diqingensis TaxID=2938121 RepID=UPI0020C1B19B|nr:hypothetical protein [Dyadobacter diqingensis]
MKKYFYLIIILFLGLFYLGCTRNNTAVQQSSTALKVALKSQESASAMLDMMSDQSNTAEAKERIDPSTNVDIQKYIGVEKINIEEAKEELESAQTDLFEFAQHKSKKNQTKVLEKAHKAVKESSERLRILEEKTKVIVDFLGSETFSKSEIGAFFRPGEFHLIKEQVKEARRLFNPVVEKLNVFAGRYKDQFAGLKGEIIVTGYSDATAVEKGSALYRDLSGKLLEDDQVSQPSQQDLNQKLSELRALAVKWLLVEIIKQRKKDDSALININVRVLGRGEKLPRDLPENTAKNDPRRRAVTFYSVVLPLI